MSEQNTLDFAAGDSLTLAQYAEQAYLDYAISVVRGRALPDVTDGQKPVQRRILYAMQAMGLQPEARPVKSARVVGDVLGKYHPHGDQAAYDAMVRMAQDFVLRYPLIDGQGNFGSRDGDNAAAMRYTEARLTAFAEVLLAELNEGTVDFIANYDGSQSEPEVLPARLPVVLLNGATGIAVGMATDIPPHQLNEIGQACIELIRRPDLPDEQLWEIVSGPDFPGGGQIITPAKDIQRIYQQGRGSIKVRARWRFEEMARGQWQLVVYELPPNTSAQKVLEEIEEKTNPRLRQGRRSLSNEQQQTRALLLSMLETVRDESSKDDLIRLVFEPKSSRVDRDAFVEMLLAHTSMEANYSINLVSIDTQGRPRQTSFRDMLVDWLDFRRVTVRRRTQHRLDKANERIHVLEGRMIVYLDVDAVIQTIRDADEPKTALIERFHLSERQAEDILEMRLRQLARLEGIKIEQELEKLAKERARLEKILSSNATFNRLLISELENDIKKYGDTRRTLIQEAEQVVLETPVLDEPVTVIISQQGWLRRRQGHGHDRENIQFKSGDAYYDAIECRSVDDLIALGSDGRSYTVAVHDLPPARGDGQPITAYVDVAPESQIVHMLVGNPKQRVLLGIEQGFGFITQVTELMTRQRAGKQFVTVAADERLLKPLLLADEDDAIALLTENNRLLVVSLDELRLLKSGGRGTTLIGLDAGDRLSQWCAVGRQGIEISGIYRRRQFSWLLDLNELEDYRGRRARKGKFLTRKIQKPVMVSANPD